AGFISVLALRMGHAREADLDALPRELQGARALEEAPVEIARGRRTADIALTRIGRRFQAQSAVGFEAEEGSVPDRIERGRVVSHIVVELQQDQVRRVADRSPFEREVDLRGAVVAHAEIQDLDAFALLEAAASQ